MPQANPAEDIVEEVLKRMASGKSIAGFLKNYHGDRLDQEGIDFLIILNNGLAAPLQVKTHSGKERNEKKHREHLQKHPLVQFFIAVDVGAENPETVYRYIERELRYMVRRAMSRSPLRPPQ